MTHTATIPDRIRARGVSLIEGVLYLVLALAIIVGGIVFFQQASFSRQVNAMAGMMTSVSGQLVHGLKSNSQTKADPIFEAADMSQYAIRAGMVPSELVAVTSGGDDGLIDPGPGGLISFDGSEGLPVPMPLSGVTGDFGIVKAQSADGYFDYDFAMFVCEDIKAGNGPANGTYVTVTGDCTDEATLRQLEDDMHDECLETTPAEFCSPMFSDDDIFGPGPGEGGPGAGGPGSGGGAVVRSFWGGIVSFAEASVLVDGQRTPILAARMNDLPTGACMRLGHKNAGGDTQVGVNVLGIAVEDNGMTNDDWAWTQGEVLHFTGPGEETDFDDLSTACDRDNPDLVVYYEVNGVPDSGELPVDIDYPAAGGGGGSCDPFFGCGGGGGGGGGGGPMVPCSTLPPGDPTPCLHM